MKKLKISEIQITPVKPFNGLIAFASFVIDDSFYIGSVGVHKKLNAEGYRLTYATKKVGDKGINIFHPINKEVSKQIEESIFNELIKLFEKSNGNSKSNGHLLYTTQ